MSGDAYPHPDHQVMHRNMLIPPPRHQVMHRNMLIPHAWKHVNTPPHPDHQVMHRNMLIPPPRPSGDENIETCYGNMLIPLTPTIR